MQKQAAQNPTQKTKQKYLKPQIFSISNTLKPTNAAHCRSLVDLNNVETSSEKENYSNDHFSSVTSNQDTRNVRPMQEHYGGNGNGNRNQGKFTRVSSQNRQVLVDKGNISNIAKILLNASKGKNGLYQVSSNKNSTNHLHGQGRKHDVLSDMLNPKHHKQARTSSQTHLREANNSLTKKDGHQFQTLQSQKSEKSLKKAQPPSPQPQPQHPQPQPQTASQRNLLIKLKEYIEQLKCNEQIQEAKLAKLTQENKSYQQELTLLKDKVEVYQIRERQMLKRIKQLETELTRQPHPTTAPKNICQEHQLIIQSLRNVINEQMSKIIEMETYKVQWNEHNKRAGGNRGKGKDRGKDREGYWETNQSDGEGQGDGDGTGRDGGYQEVYSFKKRNNLNQSSIYIEDQQRQAPMKQRKKDKASQSSIPQPYKQLIKCLKTESRVSKPSPSNPPSSRPSPSLQSSPQSASPSRAGQDYLDEQEQAYKEELMNERDQCSEDQILQEVGQYLQNIRRNVRDG